MRTGAAVAIIVLTAIAYGPAYRADWIWDDDSYVTANAALRSSDGLRRIWFEPGAVAQYYPLTFTTLWAEYQIHGSAPLGYHVTNVLLHAANAVLVGIALEAVAVPGPWVIAALFAVHPVHVESVAWVTERKNVLSAFFYLLSFAMLLRWRRDADAHPGTGARWYAVALACFGAALLSKTVTSTLPMVFLIARWWQSGRVRRTEVLAMLPFVAMGALAGAVTTGLERTHVGAVGPYWNQSVAERVLIAGRALWFYVGKLCWPWPLVFIYPRWSLDVGSAAQWAAPVAAGAVGIALLVGARRLGRGPLAAALCFAVTLAPALGFVPVYPMRYSFVADHFAYLASVPLLALLVGAIAPRLSRDSGRVVAVVIVAVLATTTWNRSLAFADGVTLWRDTLAKNPAATIAYLNLGYETYQAGRYEEAIALFDRGLAIEPGAADLLNDRGLALSALGRTDEAMASYRRAAEVDPGNVEARSNLGNTLASLGRYEEAAVAYRDAIRLRPRYAEAHNNLANVLALMGEASQALAEYRLALEADPAYVDAQRNMGEVLLAAGRAEEACASFAEALRLRPGELGATIGRVRCLAATGHTDDAIATGTGALRAAPQSAALRAALAHALAKAGRSDEAAARYREAVAMDPSLAAQGP